MNSNLWATAMMVDCDVHHGNRMNLTFLPVGHSAVADPLPSFFWSAAISVPSGKILHAHAVVEVLQLVQISERIAQQLSCGKAAFLNRRYTCLMDRR